MNLQNNEIQNENSNLESVIFHVSLREIFYLVSSIQNKRREPNPLIN